MARSQRACPHRRDVTIATQKETPGGSGLARRRELARKEGGAAYLERRAQLIAAAAEVFKRKGFENTSLGDIAESAGTDRASLYYYISDKRELFDEIVSDVINQNMTYAEHARDSSDPPAKKLHDVIVVLMTSCDVKYPYAYIYLQENLTQTSGSSAKSRRIARYGERYARAFSDIVQQGLDDGSFRSDAPSQVIALGIVGMINWSHRWFKPGRGLSGAEIGEAFAKMALGGLNARTR